jgi:hypothetical protein
LEEPLVLGSGCQEVLVFVGETEERVSSCQVFLGELDHAIALIFKLSVDIGDVLDINLLRRSKGVSPGHKGIRIGNEILEFLLTLESVYLAIEECNVLIVLDTDLDVLPANLVADGTEVKIL